MPLAQQWLIEPSLNPAPRKPQTVADLSDQDIAVLSYHAARALLNTEAQRFAHENQRLTWEIQKHLNQLMGVRQRTAATIEHLQYGLRHLRDQFADAIHATVPGPT